MTGGRKRVLAREHTASPAGAFADWEARAAETPAPAGSWAAAQAAAMRAGGR